MCYGGAHCHRYAAAHAHCDEHGHACADGYGHAYGYADSDDLDGAERAGRAVDAAVHQLLGAGEGCAAFLSRHGRGGFAFQVVTSSRNSHYATFSAPTAIGRKTAAWSGPKTK